MNDFIQQQLALWPMAKTNYDCLALAERRNFNIGDMPVSVQFNPGRILSTAAKVDSESISNRPCFLCLANRPPEQMAGDIDPEWSLLVNPFPIFPVHFTIVSKSHEPQAAPPIDMASFAEKLPETTVFFNGAKAGASAPDHLHCQAVLKSELPLLKIAERYHSAKESGWMLSSDFQLDLPFIFISCLIRPDFEGMRLLAAIPEVTGIDKISGLKDPGLVNTFFWTDDSGIMRALIIPRKAHRPSHYFKERNDRRVISPGAIDMAGIIITPRKEDFTSVSSQEIKEIFNEVAFADSIPEAVKAPLADIKRLY